MSTSHLVSLFARRDRANTTTQLPLPRLEAKSSAVPNSRLVERLAAAPLFREFRRAFEDATGLPLTLRAVEGWQLAHRASRNQNGFCALMSQTSRSCSACLQVQERVCAGVNGVSCTLNCSFGMAETAVGVKIGHQIIAYLQTGQVFFQPPTPQQTRGALQQIKAWGLDLDLDDAAQRFQATPVVRRGEYQARVRLLEFFADQLGATANQIVMQQQTAEPAQITRARQFIEAHHQEQITLTVAAQQAGMSTFYFCKRFKQATGVNFTHYVSRVRVEKAKNLLLNLNYRVGEIALEVGFQSLTHFNRMFKNIAGYSPREFRQRLPAV